MRPMGVIVRLGPGPCIDRLRQGLRADEEGKGDQLLCGGECTMEYTNVVLQSCTPEIYTM